MSTDAPVSCAPVSCVTVSCATSAVATPVLEPRVPAALPEPYRPDDPICVKCAATRRTCCQDTEIYVTPADVRRIEDHTGRSAFFDFRLPVDPVYLDQGDDPTWNRHVFRGDGTRRTLLQQENGDCTFLTHQGCGLPLEVRPLVCRLYPYHYNDTGIVSLAQGCPTALLKDGETILTALDMNRRQAEGWHALLYRELCEETH